jgi:hypothetical protein
MNDRTKNNLKYGLGSIAFVIIFFAILIIPEVIKSNREFDILSSEGVIADCIIIHYYVSRTRSNTYYMVVCKYFVDGLVYYTKDRAVTKKDYQIGDTLKIVYSKHDPTVHRIIDPYTSNDIELMDSVMIRLAEKDIQIYGNE